MIADTDGCNFVTILASDSRWGETCGEFTETVRGNC
jgi:hypothetical protein